MRFRLQLGRIAPRALLVRRPFMRRRLFRRTLFFPRGLAALLIVPLLILAVAAICRFTARAAPADQLFDVRQPDYVDLAYADLSDANRLDLYLPDNATPPYPLIIWVHGGAWQVGDKSRAPAAILTARGYAVASINYRLSGEASFPAQIHDVKAAVRWLRANAETYQLDVENIGAWGASAGGHLVSLLGTSGGVEALEDLSMGNAEFSSEVQAVVNWYGASILYRGDFARGDLPLREIPSDLRQALNAFLGCDLTLPVDTPEGSACQTVGETASPIIYIDENDPPFLIQHGTDDPISAVEQSEIFYVALSDAGVDVTLNLFEGAGHGGREFLNRDNLRIIADFFRDNLR